MQKLIIQPCSSTVARINYERTIKNYINIDDIKSFLTAKQVDKLFKYFPDGKLHIWGVVDGRNAQHLSKWNSINFGDVAIFTWNNAVRSCAIIFEKLINSELAYYLWNDAEYKNIYFVGQVENIDISYNKFNKILGYNEGYVYQGFSVLPEDKSLAALDFLGVDDTSSTLDVSHADFEKAVNKLNLAPTLDREASGNQRIEQAYLRKQLFGEKNEARCAICGKTYPIEFLVAAHIKRRADCSLEERKDFKNIVFSACKFGCDDLYEKGYILVCNGKYIINPTRWIAPSVKSHLADIEDRSCEEWNEATIKYFNAHNEKFEI